MKNIPFDLINSQILNEDQQKEVREKFLRRGDYTVEFTDEVIQNKAVRDL